MYMNWFKAILLFGLSLLVGCENTNEATTIETQQGKIVSFLTSSHSPKLIAEADIAESLVDQPEFYATSGYSAYRYIADYYNSEREGRKEVTTRSKLLITFWCHDFSSYAKPSGSNIYYTNDPLYEDALAEAGLNTEYWSFAPLEVVFGRGDILKSVEDALVGCREGDYVEIYLTFNMAYGDQWTGVTNLESPIAFICSIDSVN